MVQDASILCSVIYANMILIITLLVLRVNVISSYNIHEKPSSMLLDATSSYFGYSVVLHAQRNPPKSWLIVGAPKSKLASVEVPGLVYRYDLQSVTSQPVRIQPKELVDEKGFIDSVNHNALIKKDYGWFGASMAIEPNKNILTVCAPRSMITLYTLSTRFESMHGVCYSGNITADRLQLDDKNLQGHDFTTEFWYNPLHGFSVHYPSSDKNDKMIIGSPKEELVGSVSIKDQISPVYFPKNDDRTMLGYAVTSGYFFNKRKLLYAGGAPGWHLIGRVGIIDPTTNPGTVIAKVDGTTIGEYFGASLAACDLNNDGLDEIIVGAPHWGEDHGRVYIYLGNVGTILAEADVVLNGHKEQSRFGYSLTCGDLDRDGFNDLIVGAPWEENGVVYIYNGDSSLDSKFQMNSQNITVTLPVTTFGFSLAKPVDIDFNGFPDLAIGAYKSNYAMVLNSRPVIKSNVYTSTIPSALDRNSTSFVIKVCVNHTKIDSPSHESFNLTITIDGGLNRVQQSQVNLSHISSWDDIEPTVCLFTPVNLTERIRNYIDPITITMIHNYGSSRITEDKGIVECSLCPIEYNRKSKSREINIPFDIGCGADKICTSFISISGYFYYASIGEALENNIWIIGSKDISLRVNISNDKEPAYLTVLTLTLPKNTFLRSLLDSCTEKEDDGITKVICDVDNPLLIGLQRTLIFDLDMSRINNGSHENTNLSFTATVTTRSRNQGDSSVIFPLRLRTNASLMLEGRANERSYDILSAEDSIQNIAFEHLYQISKFGFTPVSSTRLTVKVPYRVGGRDFLVLLDEPKISMFGRIYQCSTHDIPIIPNQQDIPEVMDSDDTEKSQLNANNNHSRSKRNTDSTLPSINPEIHNFSNNSGRFSSSTASGFNLSTLNCSSMNVQCGEIICDVGALNADRDSASLRLKFSMNFSKLMEDVFDDNGRITEFVTEAWVVQIVNWTVSGTGNVTKVTTTFIKMTQTSRLNAWIVTGCIFLGLLALFLIAIALRLMGFFERKTKEKMDEIKESDGNRDTNRLSNSRF